MGAEGVSQVISRLFSCAPPSLEEHSGSQDCPSPFGCITSGTFGVYQRIVVLASSLRSVHKHSISNQNKKPSFLPPAPDLLYQTLKLLPSSALPSVLSRDAWTSWVLYPRGYSLWLFLNHFVLKDYITLGKKKYLTAVAVISYVQPLRILCINSEDSLIFPSLHSFLSLPALAYVLLFLGLEKGQHEGFQSGDVANHL